MTTNIHFFIIDRSVLLSIKNASDESCREPLNTFCVQYIFFSEIHAGYEIKWKYIVDRGRPQMTRWCTLNACGITKATHSLAQAV